MFYLVVGLEWWLTSCLPCLRMVLLLSVGGIVTLCVPVSYQSCWYESDVSLPVVCRGTTRLAGKNRMYRYPLCAVVTTRLAGKNRMFRYPLCAVELLVLLVRIGRVVFSCVSWNYLSCW